MSIGYSFELLIMSSINSPRIVANVKTAVPAPPKVSEDFSRRPLIAADLYFSISVVLYVARVARVWLADAARKEF